MKKHDLNRLHETQFSYQCLVRKLAFFLELRNLEQKNLDNSSFEILDRPNLVLESRSETGQDLFALFSNHFKQGGTFLEFGAYDGLTLSNSWLLETHFNWHGVLIDPVPRHFEEMKLNRKCISIHAAVTANKKEFIKVLELPNSKLSKPVIKRRFTDKVHKVPAFTLTEIIDRYFPSKSLDFLSIDVEGEDLEILASVDFSKYQINAICVEHNYRTDSQEFLKYLEVSGYTLVWNKYSGNDFWFIRQAYPVKALA